MAQDSKGGERDGNLDDDRANRQEPDFALGLPIHVFPGQWTKPTTRRAETVTTTRSIDQGWLPPPVKSNCLERLSSRCVRRRMAALLEMRSASPINSLWPKQFHEIGPAGARKNPPGSASSASEAALDALAPGLCRDHQLPNKISKQQFQGVDCVINPCHNVG